MSDADENQDETGATETVPTGEHNASDAPSGKEKPKEIGGRDGPDPTRYGDWEKNGRCIDF